LTSQPNALFFCPGTPHEEAGTKYGARNVIHVLPIKEQVAGLVFLSVCLGFTPGRVKWRENGW